MATLLVTHPDCIAHDPGAGHPESPARLSAVLKALDEPQFGTLSRRQAPLGSKTDAARVHGARYVDAVLASVPEAVAPPSTLTRFCPKAPATPPCAPSAPSPWRWMR